LVLFGGQNQRHNQESLSSGGNQIADADRYRLGISTTMDIPESRRRAVDKLPMPA
jgi:hypothetical protein